VLKNAPFITSFIIFDRKALFSYPSQTSYARRLEKISKYVQSIWGTEGQECCFFSVSSLFLLCFFSVSLFCFFETVYLPPVPFPTPALGVFI